MNTLKIQVYENVSVIDFFQEKLKRAYKVLKNTALAFVEVSVAYIEKMLSVVYFFSRPPSVLVTIKTNQQHLYG